MGFMPMTLTAVHGVAEGHAGVASALLNTAQQVGAALGVAVLATVSTAAATGSGLLDEAQALTEGYTSAFLAGAGLLVVAAAIVGITVTTRSTQRAGETGTRATAG